MSPTPPPISPQSPHIASPSPHTVDSPKTDLSEVAEHVLASPLVDNHRELAGHIHADPGLLQVEEAAKAAKAAKLIQAQQSVSSLTGAINRPQFWAASMGMERIPQESNAVMRTLKAIAQTIMEFFRAMGLGGATRKELMNTTLDELCAHMKPVYGKVSTPSLSGLALREIGNTCYKHILAGKKDRRALKKFADDFRALVHEKIAEKKGIIDPDLRNLIMVSNEITHAIDAALNCHIHHCVQDISMKSIVEDRDLCDYVRADDGGVHQLGRGEVADASSLTFRAIEGLKRDVDREGARVNGHPCSSLDELVDRLREEGVPSDEVGAMAQLFSQNILNGVGAVLVSRFGCPPFFNLEERCSELTYDKSSGKFGLSVRLTFTHYDPGISNKTSTLPEDVLFYSRDENREVTVYGSFIVDIKLDGAHQENIKSTLEMHELLPDMHLTVQDTLAAGLGDVSRLLNPPDGASH